MQFQLLKIQSALLSVQLFGKNESKGEQDKLFDQQWSMICRHEERQEAELEITEVKLFRFSLGMMQIYGENSGCTDTCLTRM